LSIEVGLLGQEGPILTGGTNALLGSILTLLPSDPLGCKWRALMRHQHLALGLPNFQAARSTLLFFLNLPVCVLLWQPRWTETACWEHSETYAG
jgi:hypothetical protein